MSVKNSDILKKLLGAQKGDRVYWKPDRAHGGSAVYYVSGPDLFNPGFVVVDWESGQPSFVATMLCASGENFRFHLRDLGYVDE